MPRAAHNGEHDNPGLVPGLREPVECNCSPSRGKLGLLKVGQAPPRRHSYHLTPHGFAEKSRLTVDYLLHAEAKATAHLNRQGFEIPPYLKRRGHARRIETVAALLFRRHRFVAVDLVAQRWRSIYSTVGVSSLISSGDDPTAVPDGIVEALKRRENANGFIKLLDGAFTSCLELFKGMAGRERVAILLNLLGRKVRVVLDATLAAAT